MQEEGADLDPVGERRGRDLISRSLPFYLVGATPSSSSPDAWRSQRTRMREHGGRGGTQVHLKPPAMVPTPTAMDVAGKEGKEASDLDPSPPTSSEPRHPPRLQMIEVTTRDDERVGREGRCVGSPEATL